MTEPEPIVESEDCPICGCVADHDSIACHENQERAIDKLKSMHRASMRRLGLDKPSPKKDRTP